MAAPCNAAWPAWPAPPGGGASGHPRETWIGCQVEDFYFWIGCCVASAPARAARQGVREQNYIRRPLDLLRMWHIKIEAWMLEQAGIEFKPTAQTKQGLRPITAG